MLIRRAHNNRGTTVVEFALVMPVFFLLVFAIIDFGWFFFVEHTLQYATREGMRVGLVGRILQGENGNPMTRESSIIETIKENASLAVDPASLSIYIFPVGGPEDMKNPDAGEPGEYMRVRTEYTYKFLTPLISAFFTGGTTKIEAQATYKNELFDT